jgi:hypothetical protein
MTKDPTRRVWQQMLYRCNNPRAKPYPRYGGRGITVDPRWARFENFLADMGHRPEGLSLERIDNDGPYAPTNCEWTTPLMQAQNRRKTSRNTSGLMGVFKDRTFNLWLARGQVKGHEQTLYRGQDFFEACCARKSWELRKGSLL